jgi:hypothetical protein
MNNYSNKATCLALVFACGLAMISCTSSSIRHQQMNGQRLLVCDVSRIDYQIKTFPLSNIVDSIEFVRLETIDNNLIQRIHKVSVSEHYLGILDDGQGSRSYKLFNRAGDFLKHVGRVGQGPFEYIILSDAQIDESNGKVYLMPFFNVNGLLCYDLNDLPPQNIPLVYTSLDKPKFFISGDTITCFQMPLSNKRIFVFRQDIGGRLLDTIPATQHMYAANYDGEIFVTQNTGGKEVFYTAVDTLFHYDAIHNTLTPVFHAEFSRPTIHIYNEYPDYYLIWMSGWPDGKDKNVMINKRTSESYYYEMYNDFWEIPIQSYRHDNGYIILVYEAGELKQFINERLTDSRITDKLKQQLIAAEELLNPDDNPVLMIGKLKTNKYRE